MTRAEYETLDQGDKVMLVDNIEDIIDRSEKEYVLRDIFLPGEIYTVKKTDHKKTDWINIEKNHEGMAGHGWEFYKWQIVYKLSSIDLYEKLGMEIQDD